MFETSQYEDAVAIAMEQQSDDITIESTSSMDTETRQKIKRQEMYKRIDPDYYFYYISPKQKIELYSTPQNTYKLIRHAITGIRMEYYVGSKYEDLYFVVVDTLGNPRFPTENARRLYYNSPEEFERHQQMTLSQSIKEDWLYKRNSLMAKISV